MPRRVDHDVGRARCKTAPMALLERDRSLAELAAMFDEVRAAAEGRLVLVAGEAGVGKTAVLRRFGDGLPKPTRLLWGACEPLRTPRPLGPFLDVAEETGGELEQVAAGAPRPHEVASALVRELRGQVPTVLVIEDAHWADEATLDVLTLLASRIAAAPALVIASYRDDELDRDGQLRFVLGELVRRTSPYPDRAAVAVGRRPARRSVRDRRERAAPHDPGEPVLRARGARRRGRADPGDGA